MGTVNLLEALRGARGAGAPSFTRPRTRSTSTPRNRSALHRCRTRFGGDRALRASKVAANGVAYRRLSRFLPRKPTVRLPSSATRRKYHGGGDFGRRTGSFPRRDTRRDERPPLEAVTRMRCGPGNSCRRAGRLPDPHRRKGCDACRSVRPDRSGFQFRPRARSAGHSRPRCLHLDSRGLAGLLRLACAARSRRDQGKPAAQSRPEPGDVGARMAAPPQPARGRAGNDRLVRRCTTRRESPQSLRKRRR